MELVTGAEPISTFQFSGHTAIGSGVGMLPTWDQSDCILGLVLDEAGTSVLAPAGQGDKG